LTDKGTRNGFVTKKITNDGGGNNFYFDFYGKSYVLKERVHSNPHGKISTKSLEEIGENDGA